jgi:hypothetical protein
MNMPYIGATDFVTREQVERAKATITVPNRRLHVGVMTSYKVLNGQPSKWADVWLKPHQIQELFQDDGSYNVIHYADYGHSDGQRAPTTVLDLVKAWDMCGAYVHAIQLDMVWPVPSLIMELKHARPGAEIILQVSSKAMEAAGRHTRSTIDDYYGLVHYVLLDAGMGRGIPLDADKCLEIIDNTDFPPNQIAVAGGLGPETYQNLKPIVDEYPEISCDAQGRLRPSHNALDPLNMDYVEQYIKGVCSLLSTK